MRARVQTYQNMVSSDADLLIELETAKKFQLIKINSFLKQNLL